MFHDMAISDSPFKNSSQKVNVILNELIIYSSLNT